MTARRRLGTVLALLAVTALVAAGAAAGDAPTTAVEAADTDSAAADTVPAADTAPATVDTDSIQSAVAQSNATATFEDTIVTAERGATVALTVVLDGTDRATLSVGREADLNYVLNATVEDGNGDGRVVVLLDLEAAGLEATPLSTASDADSVTVTRETVVGDSIEPADYPMTLSVGGVQTGVATLIVEEPTTPPDRTTPTATPGPQAGLEPAIVRLPEGGTADFAVRFDDSDEMTLTVSGGNVSYDLQATLRDGNGDGRVPLTFDGASAGGEGVTLTARDAADSATVTSEADLDGPLPPDEYDLRLRSGAGASDPDVAVGTLVVERAATNGTATSPGEPSLPTEPALLVLAGVAVGGLGVAAGSRLVVE